MTFTDQQLRRIREAIAPQVEGRTDLCIVVNGSYARREASDQSDLDYYFVCESTADKARVHEELRERVQDSVKSLVPKSFAQDGAFGAVESITDMETNIGGQGDSNDKITRRILFLLEGFPLHNEDMFTRCRSRIVAKYIRDTITEHQLSRFLLNDLIRYYRTICVDFEFKTVENAKPWGIRNIKLMFSRKLLYFSGVLVVAESAQQTPQKKRSITHELLALDPISRIERVCGTRAELALKLYDQFLVALSDAATRTELENAKENRDTHGPLFRDLKNAGHHFTWALARLLDETYDRSHPIHNALVF